MKTALFIGFLACLSVFFLFSQETTESSQTQITVPVRVVEGGHFVDSLTREDFELLEDGKPQKIQALYLVRKSDIQRQEADQEYSPELNRTFYFLFQMIEHNPRLVEMIDQLFNQVLLPGDAMILQTPMKTYSLSPRAMATKPKKVMADEMNSILKKDIKMGNSDYESIIRELKRIIRNIAGTSAMADVEFGASGGDSIGMEFQLHRYRDLLEKMDASRLIDSKKILGFASAMQGIKGQKHIFFVYQREFRPEMQLTVLNMLQSMYQDDPNIIDGLQDLFGYYSRDVTLNVDLLNKAFADSSVNFNLIFMNQEPKDVSGISMREQSEDVFRAFSQVAQATGGTVDTSQNPVAGFQNAVKNAETFYLLYYSPEDYKKDRQFKSITVRVKRPNCSVFHRMGYFAT